MLVKHMCLVCNRPGAKRCAACNVACFCSSECEQRGTSEHAALCRLVRDSTVNVEKETLQLRHTEALEQAALAPQTDIAPFVGPTIRTVKFKDFADIARTEVVLILGESLIDKAHAHYRKQRRIDPPPGL